VAKASSPNYGKVSGKRTGRTAQWLSLHLKWAQRFMLKFNLLILHDLSLMQTYMSANYAPSRTGNQIGDIAIIELASPSDAPTLALDPGNDVNTTSNVTDWYVAYGWGLTETQQLPTTLQWAPLPGVSDAAFRKWMAAYSAKEGVAPLVLEPDHMVAGLDPKGTDTCAGDSGGALILPGPEFTPSRVDQDVQVGIVSYGLTYQCGGDLNVGMYTRVGYWRTWIDDVLSIYNLRGWDVPTRLCGVPSATCLVGGELTNVSDTPAAGVCCDACRSNGGCYAWNWDAYSKVCSLKKRTGWKVKSGDCTSGQMVLPPPAPSKSQGTNSPPSTAPAPGPSNRKLRMLQ